MFQILWATVNLLLSCFSNWFVSRWHYQHVSVNAEKLQVIWNCSNQAKMSCGLLLWQTSNVSTLRLKWVHRFNSTEFLMLSLPWTAAIHCVTGFSVYGESLGLQISVVWEYKTSIPGLHPLACIATKPLVCCYESTEMSMHGLSISVTIKPVELFVLVSIFHHEWNMCSFRLLIV